ncbi:outer membrane beta-barrel protein [Rubrivirga sp. IMCC45206]|uniref:outer membrane beta-barrel protein n=1 Tax=Rubrivirga sp. IMCC45206 TaxID=3391614 RepID=UPI00398FDEE6
MSRLLPALLLLGLVLTALAPAAAAQSSVTGTVLDAADGQPLPGATVFLVSTAPDSTRTGAAADLDGAFRIAAPAGDYRLRVWFVGYLPLDRAVTLGGAPLALGDLTLASDAAALGAVEVAATRQRVEVRGDTTAFNADAFAVNPDASAQDLLAKLPGVVVEDGTVTAQGETVQRVLVDGREFFGTDVQGALGSLPAEMIQEIQVFDRASEASRFSGFDDGDAEKTINIVTRPGMQNGQFGRAYVGAGAEGEYLAGGNVSLLDGDRRITIVGLTNNVDQQNFATEDLLGVAGSSTGRRGGGGGRRGGGTDVSALLVPDQSGLNATNALGVNYSDVLLGGDLRLTGSYVYNATDTDLDALLTREYTTGDAVSQRYAETDAADGTNTNHQLSVRAQYNVTDRTELTVEPRLTVQNNASTGTLLGVTALPSGDALAQSLTTTASDASALSGQASVRLQHRFETPGRTVSVSVDGGLSDQAGESLQAYALDSFSDAISADAADQLFDTDALTQSLGASVRYTEPVGTGQLQLSYRPQVSTSTSDQLAFLADGAGAYTVPDAAYTSRFSQQSVIQRGGVSYRYGGRGRDALSAQIGVDLQHETLQGTQTAATSFHVDRTFWSVLPSARLRLPLAEGQRLDLDYRARTETPSATQLQNVVDNANPLRLTAGNPDLDPATTHSVRARFNGTDAQGGSVLAGFLSASYGVNAIGTSTTTATVDTALPSGVVLPAGAQLITPVNVDGAWDARALVSYGRPVPFLGSNANASIGTSFSRTPGLVDGADNTSDQIGLDGRVFLGSSLSPRFDLSLEYGARYTAVANSAAPALDDTYVRHLAGAKLTWLPWNGLVVSSDLQALHYTGLDASVDPTQMLLGGRVGYKFLQGDLAEVSLSVYDLLDQQRDVERTVTEAYIEDAQTTALGRYVLLNLSYKLRAFGG